MQWRALRMGGESKDPLYIIELPMPTSTRLFVRRPVGDGVIEFVRAGLEGAGGASPTEGSQKRAASGGEDRYAARSRSRYGRLLPCLAPPPAALHIVLAAFLGLGGWTRVCWVGLILSCDEHVFGCRMMDYSSVVLSGRGRPGEERRKIQGSTCCHRGLWTRQDLLATLIPELGRCFLAFCDSRTRGHQRSSSTCVRRFDRK